MRPDQLAQLWSMGDFNADDSLDLTGDCQREELLQDQLAAKLPVDRILAQALPQVFAKLLNDMRPFAGGSMLF
jgi:hypothetical protein